MVRSQRVVLGVDHRGASLRSAIVRSLEWLQCSIDDVGAQLSQLSQPAEYPGVAAAVARPVSFGLAERGILVGATGLEMAIIANKFPGVRAAACFDEVLVETSRRHLDLNVLCLSADLISEVTVEQMVFAFLGTPFDGAQHARRIGELAAIERGLLALPAPTWLETNGAATSRG